MEAACKAARGFTGRSDLVTVEGGWYGQTGFALSLSDRKDKDSYGPLIPNVRTMPFGSVEVARKTIGSDTAAVILEPVQAENHCRAATPEYIKALAGLCRERGAVLIIDETQTGFGRTGTKFAYESSGITPDILVLGEALGGGMFPIAATLLTQRVNAFMNAHPLIHLSTFGGADVGCRVASKAIEIYSREQPWRNAAEMGERLLVSLRQLQRQAESLMRDVTGKGLLLSLDLGSPENAKRFCKAAAANGLLVLPGEVAAYTIVLRPPLAITAEQASEIVASVRAALESL
jgi:acetylornithine/succinyldiaminopimelate/putrescine aminotransferase